MVMKVNDEYCCSLLIALSLFILRVPRSDFLGFCCAVCDFIIPQGSSQYTNRLSSDTHSCCFVDFVSHHILHPLLHPIPFPSVLLYTIFFIILSRDYSFSRKLKWQHFEHFLLLCPAVSYRSIHRDDGSLLPEEEDRLLCHPDLHALLHDCNPVTGFLLAQPGVCASTDCLW